MGAVALCLNTSSIESGPGSYKLNTTVGDVPTYAMPNRKLMIVHFINVSIYTIFLVMGSYF